MKFKIITLLISSIFAIQSYSSASINNSANISQIDTYEAPEIVKINQSYFIDGIEIKDSSELINNNQTSVSLTTTASVSNWNMVSKNLDTGTLDFFYFDQDHYMYRQFAYDEEQSTLALTTASVFSNTSTLNDYSNIECAETETFVNTDGSISLVTEGYDPDVIDTNDEYSLMTYGIIGDDDRTVVSDTTTGMYKFAGNIVAKYNVQNLKTGNIDTLYYGSTGFMEGPDILVTAGHSVYGDVTSGNENYEDNLFNPRFPDEIYYYPARNGSSKPYGGVTVERVYLEKSYYQETTKDWACCKLSTKIGNTTGWFGKISYFYQENYAIKTIGYPSTGNSQMYESSGNMIYFESSENGYYYRTNLDADGGQSGSPYIINLNGNNYVCGIHTYAAIYTSSGETAYTGGIRIDGIMFAFLNSFVTSESLYDIKIEDYGFADAYPTDDDTKNNFITHNLSNGLSFRTRRYRTGYIQQEYIVMSPIRDNIPEMKAYIEYSFNRPIEKMDVDLTMWRPSSTELITSSNGNAYLQVPGADGWVNQLDLLSSETALPTDRTQPKTYTIEFETPVYSFRFYSEYNGTTYVSGSNRGRICIGDMRLQFQKNNYMPLNWNELEYNPSIWKGTVEQKNNCYGYALNNQVKPGTNTLWYKQQPGEYSGNTITECTANILVNAVTNDFNSYSSYMNTTYKFEPIGKYEKCPEGTYKVALVCYKTGWWIFTSQDYHWYRQDADGYWSHKQGTTAVKRTDDSGMLITDPETCDRGSYTNFVGYFAVTPWSNLYVQ